MDIPTLLIWATNDPISPLAVGRYLAGLLPRANLIAIDADDHMFAVDHGQLLAGMIENHLRKPK